MPDIWYDVDAALAEVPVNLMPLIDSTDFVTVEDAIAYDAAGMDLRWNFCTTAGAYTSTAVTPTTSGNYDWAHQGDGMYSIEITASGGASINNDTEGFGWFTGKITGVLPFRGPVCGFRAGGLNDLMIDSAYSTTRGLSGTALPAAAADAAGGLIISDAGGLDADAQRSDVAAILVDTGTTLDDLIDTEIATIVSAVAAIETDTQDIQARLPAALTADGNIKADTLRVGGTLQTAGDIPAMVTAVDDLVDTEVAAIKTVVDAILVDTGTDGVVVASINANAITATAVATGAIDALALATDAVDEIAAAILVTPSQKIVTDASGRVDVGAVGGNTTVPTNMIRAFISVGVDSCGAGSTTTSINTANLVGTVADQYKGRIITFSSTTTTAALRNQSTDITASSLASPTVLTTTALTTAPASGDIFVIT